MIACVYAGVAVSSPLANVAAAQAAQAWPWERPSNTNTKPSRENSGFSSLFGGMFGGSSARPSYRSSSSSPGGMFGGWFRPGKESSGGAGGWRGAGGFSPQPKAPAAPKAPVPMTPEPMAPAPMAPESMAPESMAPEPKHEAEAAKEAPEAPASMEMPGVETTLTPEEPAPPQPEAPKSAKPSGSSVQAMPKSPSAALPPLKSLWQPRVASLFQIVLEGSVEASAAVTPEYVDIFDIDLFNTDKTTIQRLRSQGKKVICYFSAGSTEDWRPDFKKFQKSEMGNKISKDDSGGNYWEGERWLNIKNPNPQSEKLPNVWAIMRDRIQMAAEKGCNAIDPDNTGKLFDTTLRALTK
jgi:hypothetical protein